MSIEKKISDKKFEQISARKKFWNFVAQKCTHTNSLLLLETLAQLRGVNPF